MITWYNGMDNQKRSKKHILNPEASWMEKRGVLAVYHDFNFYFFENQPKVWLSGILRGDRIKIPRNFLDYLHDNNLLA